MTFSNESGSPLGGVIGSNVSKLSESIASILGHRLSDHEVGSIYSMISLNRTNTPNTRASAIADLEKSATSESGVKYIVYILEEEYNKRRTIYNRIYYSSYAKYSGSSPNQQTTLARTMTSVDPATNKPLSDIEGELTNFRLIIDYLISEMNTLKSKNRVLTMIRDNTY